MNCCMQEGGREGGNAGKEGGRQRREAEKGGREKGGREGREGGREAEKGGREKGGREGDLVMLHKHRVETALLVAGATRR